VITREELYELVWSAPMIKVAEKFDVSGSYTGGASALLVYRQDANRGLQGLRFAVTVPGAGAADKPGGGVQWIRAEQAASAQLGARCG